MELSESAKEARRQYHRAYYWKNRQARLAYMKEWREQNPEKVQQYLEAHWERKAQEVEGGLT